MSAPAYCRPAAYRAFAEALPVVEAPAGLFRAAWAIALHEMPEAKLSRGEGAIRQLISTVERRVHSSSPDALLAHLHDVLFEVIGFRGNEEDYYNPANSYLPEVLRTRRGLPITLTMVYLRVATGLGLMVHGVNAPGHFLAEVELDGGARSMYVDPFYRGRSLDEAEVYAQIAEATGQPVLPDPRALSRATPRQWLIRMLHNLQATFAAAGRERDVFAMQELEALVAV